MTEVTGWIAGRPRPAGICIVSRMFPAVMSPKSIRRAGPAAVVALGLLIAACGGSAEAEFNPPPDEQYPQSQLEAGRDVFLSSCTFCHGNKGEGGTGPNLRQVWERRSPEDHLQKVTEGGNGMPGFGRSLTEQQIADVVAFERAGWDLLD